MKTWSMFAKTQRQNRFINLTNQNCLNVTNMYCHLKFILHLKKLEVLNNFELIQPNISSKIKYEFKNINFSVIYIYPLIKFIP